LVFVFVGLWITSLLELYPHHLSYISDLKEDPKFLGHKHAYHSWKAFIFLNDSQKMLTLSHQNSSYDAHQRFLKETVFLKKIIPYRLGFKEIFALPAFYFIFEDTRPDISLNMIDNAFLDSKYHQGLPSLAGFIELFFMNRPYKAALYYEKIPLHQRPFWLKDLIVTLKKDENPLHKNSKTQKDMCHDLKETFPTYPLKGVCL
jgi:hypothetical protein